MLFEDTFEVTAVNPEGKKFDKGETEHSRHLAHLMQPLAHLSLPLCAPLPLRLQ